MLFHLNPRFLITLHKRPEQNISESKTTAVFIHNHVLNKRISNGPEKFPLLQMSFEKKVTELYKLK